MIRYVPYSRVVSLPKPMRFLQDYKGKRKYVQFLAVKLKEPAAIAAMLTGKEVEIKSIRDPRIESHQEVTRRVYQPGYAGSAFRWAWDDTVDHCKHLNRKAEQEKI